MLILQILHNHLDSIKKNISIPAPPGILNNPKSTIAENSLIDSNILAALIGAGVSLVVLLATIFYDRWQAKKEDKRQRNKKLIYFAALIKPIISYSEEQAKSIKAFAESIQDDPLKFPLMTFSPKNALEKIVDRIDEEPFFNAYTSFYVPYATSVRTFKGITSVIEYQNLQMNQVLEMAQTSQNFDHERKLKFKTSLKAANDMAANAVADQTMAKYPGLLKLLNTHLGNFLSNRNDTSDLKFAHDAFVHPVMNGIVTHGFYAIPVALTIANHLHDATEVYHEIVMQMNAVKDDFLKISTAYEASNIKLKEHAQQLLHDFFDTIV